VAVVLAEDGDPRVRDGLGDAERARAVVTDRGVVADRQVQLVVVAVGVFEFRDPLGARAVEDHLDLVAVRLGELLCGLQSVREAAVVGVRFVAGENRDRCVCHRGPVRGGYINPVPGRVPPAPPQRGFNYVIGNTRRGFKYHSRHTASDRDVRPYPLAFGSICRVKPCRNLYCTTERSMTPPTTLSADTIHVLHVDQPPITEALASALGSDGRRFAVRTANTPDEGLEALGDGDVDCVVAGYDLPTGDGLSFLDAVREVDPDLPFVLHADRRAEDVAERALNAGATDCVPTEEVLERHAVLSARVRNAVERARAARRAEAARRIGRVVRELDEALARATTREEVDDRVCAILSDAEPYRFAWIGEHDPDSRTVEPRSSAGVAEAYLEAVEIRTDESPAGLGPTGRAVRSGEIEVMQNIRENPEYEPWREAALERGYRSSAAVPLIHDGTLYGVLNVYADRPDAFDDRERRLLSSAGETIAHAYRRIELQRRYTDQYRTLFEEAPVMVVFTEAIDGEPIVEDCNRAFAEHLGYTREELRGTPLTEHYTDRSAEQLLEGGYDRALAGDFLREQRTLVARDGTETLTVLRAAPRRDRDGDIVGTHALFLDITDEVQIRKLERQNERLEEFAGVLSHDLRNPLNVAQGRLELVAETCDSEDIPPIRHAHERMEALIEDLLTLAREGTAVTDPGVVDLAALAEDCWANVDTAGATLEIETDRSILADGDRLKRVFENLIRNAAEHGGGDVTVRIGDLPDEAGFYVEDDGPGIPESDREAVFEAGHSTNADGTGFGLSIVQGIVEAHDWSVRAVESDDGGARFEITGVEYAGA